MAKGRPSTPPDEREAAREAELQAAHQALARGDFDVARQHVSDAERLGAPGPEVHKLRSTIARAEKSLPGRMRKSFWIGFLISALGYCFVAFRQPLQWTEAVWAALAFLVVPALSGLASGRSQGLGSHAGERFRPAFFGAAWPMFWYTLINLIVLRTRLQSGPEAGQLFVVVMLVTIVYAAIAGTVAGLVGSRLAWLGAERRTA